MTNHLDKTSEVAGMPASKLQAVLSSWTKGKTVQELSRLSKVDARPGIVAALLGEAWLRDLISTVDDRWLHDDDGMLGLTRSGVAVIAAEKRGRTSKEKANAVLQDMLRRVEDLSKDPKAPMKVDKIWVFGSLLDESKDDVGDIDVVIESYRTGVVPFREMHDYVEENYPGVITDSFRYWRDHASEVFLNKAVFGPRRHRLLAPNDISTLQGLHAPCAVVFDRARGGIVDPEVLPHHPNSTERAEWIRDRLVLPDLSERRDEFVPTPPFVVSHHFRKRAPKAVTEPPREHEAGDSFRLSDIQENSALVRREFTFGEREWLCSFTIEKLDLREEHQAYGSHWNSLSLADQIVTLAHADLARLADYRDHLSESQDICINILPPPHAPRPFLAALDRAIERAMGDQDDRADMSGRFAFGLRLTRNGVGAYYASASEYYGDDSKNMQDDMPFVREDYTRLSEGDVQQAAHEGFGLPRSRFA